MFVRIFSSAPPGLAITAGLLYLMHFLIVTSEGAIDPRPPIVLNSMGRTIDDSEVIVEKKRPKRIAPPLALPQLPKNTDPGETFTPVRGRPTVEPPRAKSLARSVFGYTDGALINIIAVKPNYPTAASSRGLEGYVIVQFDVTAMGTVNNVIVVESSSSLFNKAAVNAAKKFRFKPKVIDGVPQNSYGVRRLFTFEMEEK